MAETLEQIFGSQESVESLDDIFADTNAQKQESSFLPQAGEIAGSMVGSMVPGVGILTSAVGAGTGRAVGEVAEDIGLKISPTSGFLANQKIDRQVVGLQNMMSGMVGGLGEYVNRDKDIAKKILIDSAIASSTDLAFGAALGAFGKITDKINTGVARGLFGKEVADRFLSRPKEVFSRLGKEPSALNKRAAGFFKGLSDKLGKNVENVVIGSKKLSTIDNEIKAISDFTENGNLINSLDIPKGQKTRINKIIDEIASKSGKQVDAKAVWEIRKNIDSAIEKTSRLSEGRTALYRMRNVMSEKLKTFDTNISKVFKDYQFAKESQDEIGKFMKGIETPGGETISRNLERFAKNLLNSDNSQTIKLLQEIDGLAPAEQKIATELLDEAAKEGIMKDIHGSIPMRAILQTIGGPSNIAKFLALPRSQQAIAIERVSRGILGTATTELVKGE